MDNDLKAANEAEQTAIHNFLIDVTIPIITKIDDQYVVIGTGTLFRVAGRRFLITTAHTAEDYPDMAEWAFPTAHDTGTLQTFGKAELIRPKEEGFDVCALELYEPAAIDIIEKGWRWLTLDDVWLPDFSAQTVYLAGFPSIRAKWDGQTLRGRMFVVPTTYYTEPPASAGNSDSPVDLTDVLDQADRDYCMAVG